MIKIKRPSVPDYMNSPKIQKAKKLLEDSFKNSQRQSRLRFDSSLLIPIKKLLLSMTQNKCAYCESKLGVISTGDIEYFRPKSGAKGLNPNEYAPNHYWWLFYEWENLLIACQICNQKYKGSYFPLENERQRSKIGAKGAKLLSEKPLLIDPCIDDPSEHLSFSEKGIAEGLTKKGKVTIEILGLNRMDLVESRELVATLLKDKLKKVRLERSRSGKTTKELLSYIKDLYSVKPTQPYVAIQRKVFDNWYEKNSALWEDIKQYHNDRSITRIKQMPASPIDEVLTQEIASVSAQLTSLKRFSIKSIEIENFKSIEKMTLSLKPVDEKEARESWLLLLGDNGIGKSSILQAIALALCSKKQLQKLNLNVLDYLRRKKDKGHVKIHSFEHDDPIVLLFTKNGFKTKLEEAPTFILGYGSTRLLPKGNIVSDNNKEPYLNVRNLFDYSIALNDPNKWLSSIGNSEFEERVAPAFFDVLALRDNDRVWIDNGKVKIKQSGEDQTLEENSDGYKTITALVSDIMQTLSIDKANYHNSQGIVLIDEIGNHLHPRWRMKIASALRKAFPKLQFIVTTHEPLCLRGLSHGEVAVLVRDEKNSIKALDQSLLPDHNLLRIDQLLTSDLFGLINVMDEDTEKTYEDYYALLSKKEEDRTLADKKRIKKYSAELSEKESLGSTPAVQALFEVINETYANKIRKEGFKTKTKLKEETVSEVKQIIKNKKIDWL